MLSPEGASVAAVAPSGEFNSHLGAALSLV